MKLYASCTNTDLYLDDRSRYSIKIPLAFRYVLSQHLAHFATSFDVRKEFKERCFVATK